MLPYLTKAELAEIDRLLTDHKIWQPYKDKPQEDAYKSQADVLGYGGSAGGGKTDLVLGLAFTQHRISRLFRRRYTDLQDMVERGDAIQDGKCSFVWGVKKQWDTPDGRLIKGAAVEHDKDRFKFKGRPADFIGIDEAVDFSETVFRFLTGWLRTTIPEQRTRIVLTFNPPTTAEGEWVVKYFAPWLDPQYPDPARAGELRWFIRRDDADIEVESNAPIEINGITYTPKSRTFIPARVEDNPHLMATDYPDQLNSLPEPLRSQLLYGDFGITVKDDIWQAIPTEWVLEAMHRWETTGKPDLELKAMGVDVAAGGDDETVLAKIYGTWFDSLICYPGKTTPDGQDVTRLIIKHMEVDAKPEDVDEKDWKPATVGIDLVGWGKSAYDHSKRVIPKVRGINAGKKSMRTDKSRRYGFANLRAEMYWMLREALDPSSGQNIALPPDRELRIDLCAPRYTEQGGKIKLESKQDIIKRIHHSPDKGDAVVMAWHIAHRPAPRIRSL